MSEKPQYKGRGKLTVVMRKCLTTAARCAVKMRSTESDAKRATELLRKTSSTPPATALAYIVNAVQTTVRLYAVHRHQPPQALRRPAPPALWRPAPRVQQRSQSVSGWSRPRRGSSGLTPLTRGSLRLSALLLHSCRLTLTRS